MNSRENQQLELFDISKFIIESHGWMPWEVEDGDSKSRNATNCSGAAGSSTPEQNSPLAAHESPSRDASCSGAADPTVVPEQNHRLLEADSPSGDADCSGVAESDSTPDKSPPPSEESVWSKVASEVTPDKSPPDSGESVWSKVASEVTPDKSPPDSGESVWSKVASEVTPDKSPHWVETYSPANRLAQYYRYVWMEGQKMHHRHIRGGNAAAPTAIVRREEVERAIAIGATPSEIEQLIKSW